MISQFPTRWFWRGSVCPLPKINLRCKCKFKHLENKKLVIWKETWYTVRQMFNIYHSMLQNIATFSGSKIWTPIFGDTRYDTVGIALQYFLWNFRRCNIRCANTIVFSGDKHCNGLWVIANDDGTRCINLWSSHLLRQITLFRSRLKMP